MSDRNPALRPGAPQRWATYLARVGMSGAILLLLARPVSASSVDVVVTGLRNGRGDVRVALCSRAAFLKPTCEHMGKVRAAIGEATVRIEGVPAGIWAAQAHHDVDGDGRVGTNLLGLPTEGLGFYDVQDDILKITTAPAKFSRTGQEFIATLTFKRVE